MCLTQRIAFTNEKKLDYYLDMIDDITERGFEFKQKIPQCLYVDMLDFCMKSNEKLIKIKEDGVKLISEDDRVEMFHEILNCLEEGLDMTATKEGDEWNIEFC
jgi:hypothetical protein